MSTGGIFNYGYKNDGKQDKLNPYGLPEKNTKPQWPENLRVNQR
jgi:hypothetical protein